MSMLIVARTMPTTMAARVAGWRTMWVDTLRSAQPWKPTRLAKNVNAWSKSRARNPTQQVIQGRSAESRARGAGALDDEKAAVMRAPDHEGPIRAVPEPAEQEDESEISVGFDRRPAAP